MDMQQVIGELQRVALLLGKDAVARTEFARHGSFSSSVVERTFGSWNSAIEAAGLMPVMRFRRLSDDTLRDEFLRVSDLLGTPPTRAQCAANSEFSPTNYDRRFGRWSVAVAEYTGKTPPPTARSRRQEYPQPISQPILAPPGSSNTLPVGARRGRAFGPPLNFRELRHEPIDEQGVVSLFGMVASDLGFLVESVRQEFPDCRAKRRIRGGNYEEIDIEFEFRSRTFRDHGHDPSACDLVVCCEHNWPDCPLKFLH